MSCSTGSITATFRRCRPPVRSAISTTRPASIHPIVSKIEIRKEGKIGRVYYPAAFMNNENLDYYRDAYEIGPEALIDTYAAATEHVDQGLSLTLFFPAEATTRDINKRPDLRLEKGYQNNLLRASAPRGPRRDRGARLRVLLAIRGNE